MDFITLGSYVFTLYAGCLFIISIDWLSDGNLFGAMVSTFGFVVCVVMGVVCYAGR